MRAREFISQEPVVYHGTSSEEKFQGILKNGLKYNADMIQQKYAETPFLAPQEGGVYLTKQFGNAVRYSMMLEVDDEDWLEYLSLEPNGYVFEFSSKDIGPGKPDEDELGYLAKKLATAKSLPPNLTKITAAIPPRLRAELQKDDTEFELIAMAGKWLINKLSPTTLDYLLKNYMNVVSFKALRPVAVWVIPKPKQRHLPDRSGSFNTFDGYTNWAKRNGKRYKL